MVNIVEELMKESEELFRELEKIHKFSSKHGMYPYRGAARLVQELYKLAESIHAIEKPQNQEELLQSEMKRRLEGDAFMIERGLAQKRYDFDTIVDIYAIPREDLQELRPWLERNRDEVIESIDSLFQNSELENYELGLNLDVPSVRREAEEFSATHVKQYHRVIGKLLQDLTNVGEFLRDIEAVPTAMGRSYFHPLTKTLAIGIPEICYTGEDGLLKIKEKELITLYGHEGMGHALNSVITQSRQVPYFQSMMNAALVVAAAESVAQFYQKIIFEDLKNSPETQKELGIHHKFKEIYQEAKDKELVEDYTLKLTQYALTVLADKSLGDPHDPKTMNEKNQRISDVSIDPNYALNFIEGNRNNFDSEGNLDPNFVSELRYMANPVKRALKEFEKQGINYDSQGRSLIDETLLKGFWTPIGFVDNARIKAKESRK